MRSKRPQRADDIFDFILLKQSDACDTGRSSFEARDRVVRSDAAKSEDWNLRAARFSQGGEASGFRCGRAVLSEHRSEDDEVSFLRLSAQDVVDNVARCSHKKLTCP